MGRKPRRVKDYTPEQIKDLFTSDDKYKIGPRLYVVYQVFWANPVEKGGPFIQHHLQANSQRVWIALNRRASRDYAINQG